MSLIISNTLKSRLSKVLWITAGWTFISMLLVVQGYANFISADRKISDPDFWLNLKGSLITGILAGIIGGSGVVFFWEKWLRTKKYGWSLWSILWTYTVIYFIVSISTGLFLAYSNSGLQFYYTRVWQTLLSAIFSMPGLVNAFIWLLVVLTTLIVLLVNDKYGPGVFRDFLLGKYFHPKREERIFMFMDMRSSTSIAEKIGNEKYFNLLNDLFSDITDTILNNEGEIYQYIGDEIVISWSIKKGIRNANCLRCFTQIQEKLIVLGPIYEKKYKLIPEFKAGLHYGLVMAGEIGVIKKDIIYSGDVLNTTARIQEQCNQYSVDILISKETFDLISDTDGYKLIPLGSIELRGKERKIDLNTVRTI